MATKLETIQQHLANLPGGVGCRHLAQDNEGISPDLLIALGLVRPIVSRVPRCADHGCPLLENCPHRVDFEPEAKGSKSGIKYRPTPEGLAATADPAIIEESILQLPAAREILALIAAGTTDRFRLHTAFISHARAAARAGDAIDLPALNRVTLTAVLDLLLEAGAIDGGPAGFYLCQDRAVAVSTS